MSFGACVNCGSAQIEAVKAQGELVCRSCGFVLQENIVSEDMQYSEAAGGNATLVGQFVPTVGSRGLVLAYGSWQTREQVIRRGHQNIQRIADYLNLSTEHVEAARRIYLLAVQRNFTMGRNNLHVASCCLYTICRREKTPYLLIDFADILQSPVKTIGQVFMKLVRMLHIQVPNVDPSIFFERFASQLHLKDKVQKVVATGIRIIQAMNRDWLCTGRRPTGLCGAALIVAARYHGIPLNAEAVASIVRISHPTIQKRLAEFKATSVAQLKTADFESADLNALPTIGLPPCLVHKLQQIERKSGISSPKSTPDCHSEPESNIAKLSTLDIPTAQEIDALASVLDAQTGKMPHLVDALEIDEELSDDHTDDEAEFQNMILTGQEKRAKTLIWDSITKDIMPQVYRRQMERKNKEATTVVKRKYNRRNYMQYPEAATAADSARMALERTAKGVVSRINQSVLDQLLSP